ncbi:MAG: beta-galactosidase [Chloroflexi bacterium]|nr:MAG: beta-galactosidase [Chloroflexota bacterium]
MDWGNVRTMKKLFSAGKPTQMIYGGDYNPEQWPESVWLEDVQLMQEAGVNLVSLAIFSWAKLEPRPGEYDFAWLDRIIDLLYEHGISVNLATATASPPPWFSHKYPESLPVDIEGRRYKPGGRQHYCPNSMAYRETAVSLTTQIATRYHQHPAVVMWHINNEYGCHVHECYCKVCTIAFQQWLRERYHTIAALNEGWTTSFWSQSYSDWEQIALPHRTTSFRNPGQMLDYRQFMNDSLFAIYRAEVEAVRAVGATQPVTTNFLGMQMLDYFAWVKEMDVVALDIYPDPGLGNHTWRFAAFFHDLTRSQGGKRPYLVMEQATTQVNWRAINKLKPPGMMRALSYQALLRGADGVMFFQWRASQGGAEKYHSGMVPHNGKNSRIFREVCQLGDELKRLTAVTGTHVPAQVGMLCSYQNVWALQLDSKPALIDPTEIINPWYQAILSLNVPVDIVHPDNDLNQYQVLIAPMLYQITQSQASAMQKFVENGGTLIVTYFSGIVNQQEQVWLGGYPALLKDVLGIEVEEWQPFNPDETNRLQIEGADDAISCDHWADLLHTTTAKTIATYQQDFFAGRPAITKNSFGAGMAYYLGTRPSHPYLAQFMYRVLTEKGISSPVIAGENVEVGWRTNGDQTFLFLINHDGVAETAVNLQSLAGWDLIGETAVSGQIILKPYDVKIIQLTNKKDTL